MVDGPRLRVTIVGDSTDPRVPSVREAIAYWNRELLRLGGLSHNLRRVEFVLDGTQLDPSAGRAEQRNPQSHRSRESRPSAGPSLALRASRAIHPPWRSAGPQHRSMHRSWSEAAGP